MRIVKDLKSLTECPNCGSKEIHGCYNPNSNRAYGICCRCGEEIFESETTLSENTEVKTDIRTLWSIREELDRIEAKNEFEGRTLNAIFGILNYLIAKEKGE